MGEGGRKEGRRGRMEEGELREMNEREYRRTQ